MKALFCICMALLLVSGCGKNDNGNAPAGADPIKYVSIVKSNGQRYDFKIEIALTQEQQARGLMGRKDMDERSGMLFVFPKEEERAFWMKDTLIPLDMLFIRKDGTIHHLHENAQPLDLTSVPSNGPVIAAIELKGGASKKFGIQEGDKVHHPFFENSLIK